MSSTDATTRRTPRGGAAPAPAAVRSPAGAPAGGSLFDALRANAGASRFAFTRSELAAPFTWASPVLSAGAFATVLALFVAHVGLGFSVASIAAQVSVLALAVAAVVHLHNSLQPNAALPQLSLPLDRASVSQLGVLAADRLNLGIERANDILSWEHPLASARALAYAWLAARFAWLAAPGYLFTGTLLAFIAMPAYLLAQRSVDGLLAERLLPIAAQVAKQLLAIEGSVAGAAASNATSAAVAAGAVAMVSLWLFWSVVTFSGLFTAAALAVAARDVLVSAFAGPDGGPKRD